MKNEKLSIYENQNQQQVDENESNVNANICVESCDCNECFDYICCCDNCCCLCG